MLELLGRLSRSGLESKASERFETYLRLARPGKGSKQLVAKISMKAICSVSWDCKHNINPGTDGTFDCTGGRRSSTRAVMGDGAMSSPRRG